jgi:anti-sigma B factor antagonist
MTIEKKKEGNRLILTVSGRLDAMTAPELENVIKENLNGLEELVMAFENLEYISSAGLRVVLGTRKAMGDSGKFSVRNLCSDVVGAGQFSLAVEDNGLLLVDERVNLVLFHIRFNFK